MLLAAVHKFFIGMWTSIARWWIATQSSWATCFRQGFQASDMTRTILDMVEQARKCSWRGQICERYATASR